ncbi:MAG: hypothetical protein KF851_12900 [Pirellulaceae bacterium]|nr:hypothetical protein [Pirellulaceae bacterium]
MPASTSRKNDDPQPLLLLGEQRDQPRLQTALERWKISGPVGLVAAGWEEDENDDLWVRDSIRNPVINTMLYELADELFARDPAVLALLRERQDHLRELRDVYQIQLQHFCAIIRGLLIRRETQRTVAEPLDLTFSQLRKVDAQYLTSVAGVIRKYDRELSPKNRPSIVAYQKVVVKRLATCQALLIAGGHVGVLLNRLRLSRLLNQVPLPTIAWSGGAMALGEVIFFYDHFHPHSGQETELSRHGLKCYRGVQVFPRAEQRLDLHQPVEMAMLAGRIVSRSLVMDNESELEWSGKKLIHAVNVREISADGLLKEWRP